MTNREWLLRGIMAPVPPLRGRLRLPVAARIRAHLETVCVACGEESADEYFVAGFQVSGPNLILHERCAPEEPAAAGAGNE